VTVKLWLTGVAAAQLAFPAWVAWSMHVAADTSVTIAPDTVQELAEGGYVDRSEPVVLIGEAGTGKSHLATGLCVAACQQKRRGPIHDGRSSGK